MSLPPLTLVRQFDLHRLIPSQYTGQRGTFLADLVESERELLELLEIEGATHDRTLAAQGRLPGLLNLALLYGGLPFESVVNAAFLHPSPLGSRFNNSERGAWYAGFEQETSAAEVAHHKTLQYAEIGIFEDSLTYDDYLCDLSTSLHDLHGALFAPCLDPSSYLDSQALSETLLAQGSLGVLYPSVRRSGGTCVALFHPALVGNVRQGLTLRFTWSGHPQPDVSVQRSAPV